MKRVDAARGVGDGSERCGAGKARIEVLYPERGVIGPGMLPAGTGRPADQ